MYRSFLRAASPVASLLSLVAFTSPALAESTRIESDRATLTTNPNTVGEGTLQGELGLEVGLQTYRGFTTETTPALEADVRPFGGSLRVKYGLFDNLDLELSVSSLGEHRQSEVDIGSGDGSTAVSEETAHVLTTFAPGVKVQLLESAGYVPSLSLGLSTTFATAEFPLNAQVNLGAEWEYDDFVRARLNLGGLVLGVNEAIEFDYFVAAMLSVRLLAVDAQRVDLFAEASLEPLPSIPGLERQVFAGGLLYQVSEQVQLDLTARAVSVVSDLSDPATLFILGAGGTFRW